MDVCLTELIWDMLHVYQILSFRSNKVAQPIEIITRGRQELVYPIVIAADVLATQEAESSAAMVLT